MAEAVVDPSRSLEPSSRRARGLLWFGATVASAVVVGLALFFTPAQPAPAAAVPGIRADATGVDVSDDAAQWKFLKLTTVGAAGEHWTDPVPARITIDEARASKVGVPIAGHVSRVFVELGQTVTVGQPLLSVASPDIAELRAARERAQVELEASNVTLARVEAMVTSRALAAKELLAARQQHRQAELALQLAESKLASLSVLASADHEFVVKSPRAGVVVDKAVLVDQQVTPEGSTGLMIIADLSSVWVVADIFEAQALDVRPGGAAEVTSPSLPATTLAGRVSMVSSVGDPERHTLPIRVRLDNPGRLLRPNVYARVRFNIEHDAGTTEIPASAVVSDGEHQYVFVQDGRGHFVRREIATGALHAGRLPVLSGLAEGETIVAEGAILLDNQISLTS